MNIVSKNIDNGTPFDWGRTSADYAKFRDIYPEKFYRKILERNLCTAGQSVLDLGTGTGVLPRNMYRYGAKWTATDISENQIAQARILSEGMDIDYRAASAEEADFPEHSFDVITACQCFFYFNHEKLMPNLYRMLKPGGSLLVLYMSWLPFEDEIAGAGEKLVLKYNPDWSGAGETLRPVEIPDCYKEKFETVYREEFLLKVPFTRESWNGRMKACRGIGASLSEKEIADWEEEHKKLLVQIAPEKFDILHYGALLPMTKAMDEADVIILASPVYVFHVTGAMKAFLDHYGYRWMVHRPEKSMFCKQGVCICTAAGAGLKSTNKDMADSLFFWGVGKIYRYGKAVAAVEWKDVNEKKRISIEKATTSLANKIVRRHGKIKPTIRTRLFFM